MASERDTPRVLTRRVETRRHQCDHSARARARRRADVDATPRDGRARGRSTTRKTLEPIARSVVVLTAVNERRRLDLARARENQTLRAFARAFAHLPDRSRARRRRSTRVRRHVAHERCDELSRVQISPRERVHAQRVRLRTRIARRRWTRAEWDDPAGGVDFIRAKGVAILRARGEFERGAMRARCARDVRASIEGWEAREGGTRGEREVGGRERRRSRDGAGRLRDAGRARLTNVTVCVRARVGRDGCGCRF